MSPIRVPQPKSFTPCPKGQHSAICVDVVDLGVQETGYFDDSGAKRIAHKIDIVWQVAKRMEDGRPFIVSSRYTLSFGEYNGKKSNLLLLLDAWGISTNDLLDDSNEYDVERLIGRHCILNVTHKESVKKPGNVFANVASIMPLMPGVTPMEAEGYSRRTLRQQPPVHQPVDMTVFPGDDPTDPGYQDADIDALFPPLDR